jgi:hypothetical protein
MANGEWMAPIRHSLLALARFPRALRKAGRPQRTTAGDLALQPDQVAIHADERRGAVGQREPLHLDHAIATVEAPSHSEVPFESRERNDEFAA